MPKYIITWDCGFGSKDSAVVECADDDAAQAVAYDHWREAAENNADYSAEPYTQERAEELEIEE